MSPLFFRTHYNALAKVIGYSGLSDDAVEVLLSELAKLFARDNPRFNFERFRKAVWQARGDNPLK